MHFLPAQSSLPIWFVAFDRGAKSSGWAWANSIAAEARALGMGLTYSARSEYGNAVDVVRVGEGA